MFHTLPRQKHLKIDNEIYILKNVTGALTAAYNCWTVHTILNEVYSCSVKQNVANTWRDF